MPSLENILYSIESRILDMKDARNELEAEKRASEAKGYISAAREFRLIEHDVFKKAWSDVEKALVEWHWSKEPK
jgi:hypothetical protein